MKFLKNTLFWAVLVLAGLAQDASAGRFIVLGNEIQGAVYSEKTKSASLKEGTIGFGADGSFKVVKEYTRLGYISTQWADLNGGVTPLVIDVPNVASASALESLLKANRIGTQSSRWLPKKDGQWVPRIEIITWQMAIDEANRQDLFTKVSIDQIKREAKLLQVADKIKKHKNIKNVIKARISRTKRKLQAKEQALIKALGDNLGRQYAGLSAETGVKFLTQEKIAALIEALGAVPADQQTEKSKQKLAWLRAAVKPAEAGDDASEGDGDESDDGKAPKDDNPDPKGKPKPKDEPKSLYSRCMSVHAGYRYGGAHVAFILAASMLQVMYEGYRGVGFEAKDLAELSVLKKVLRAFKVSLSPARHAANAKALFRVLRPQVQKGVVTPKILARAKQFAKDKPLVLAGLLSLIAVDVYGVCVHADDIKAFVQSLRK